MDNETWSVLSTEEPFDELGRGEVVHKDIATEVAIEHGWFLSNQFVVVPTRYAIAEPISLSDGRESAIPALEALADSHRHDCESVREMVEYVGLGPKAMTLVFGVPCDQCLFDGAIPGWLMTEVDLIDGRIWTNEDLEERSRLYKGPVSDSRRRQAGSAGD